LHNFELSASWQIPVQTITLPPPKLSGLIHTLVHKMFPTPVVHTITSIAKTKWKSGFITKKDVLPGVKSPTTVCTSPCLRSPMALFKDWPHNRTPSSESRSLLRTVWPEIRTFARPGALQEVSSAVIILFRRWIRRKCLSWRCDVTHSLLLWVCHLSYLFVEDESLALKWLF
jgi:hypothetical protein